MREQQLSKQIESIALASGYDKCGIIPITQMEGFQERLSNRKKKIPSSAIVYNTMKDLGNIKKRFPWGKAVVICTFDYGRYQFPEKLQGKYAKGYFLTPESNMDLDVYKNRQKLEQWFDEQGIQYAGGTQFGHASIGSLRHAAEQAGLGIIRKNNFLYSEKGAYQNLVGYVIDQDCELYHEHHLKPCSEHCNICQKACPTGALCAPYTMSPIKCVSFINTFGCSILLPNMEEIQMQEWVIGCEACQDACPYNKNHDWSQGEELSALTSITERLLPENLIHEDSAFFEKEVIPRTFEHLTEKQIGTIYRSAKRSLKNKKKILDK